MSMTAKMFTAYRHAIAEGRSPQHHFAWNHCMCVLARHLIGEGA